MANVVINIPSKTPTYDSRVAALDVAVNASANAALSSRTGYTGVKVALAGRKEDSFYNYGVTTSAANDAAIRARDRQIAESDAIVARRAFREQAVIDTKVAAASKDKNATASSEKSKSSTASKKPKTSASSLYYIKEFECTLVKDKYAVLSISMEYSDNGIPTVVLDINPKPNPDTSDVTSVTIDDFAEWNAKMQAVVRTDEGVGSVKMTVQDSNGVDVYKLDIKDWPITQVGFADISASGGFGGTVILQHPIYRATKGVMALLNNYNAGGYGEPLDAEDVVEAVLAAMTMYLELKEPDGADETDFESSYDITETILEVDKKVYASAKKGLQRLKENVVFDPDYPGAKFPCVETDEAVKDALLNGGLLSSAYIMEQVSPYETFMHMISELGLTLYGEFTSDKLKASPMEPWREADILIPVSYVTGMSLPMKSEDQITGVVVLGASAHSDYSATSDGDVSKSSNLTQNDIGAIGGFVDFVNTLEGRVLVLPPPSWLQPFIAGSVNGDALSDINKENDFQMEATGGENAAVTHSRLELTGDVESVLKLYATDEFWRRFRQDVIIRINLKFMLHQNNITLRPGRVITIVSESGKPAITCYIIGVKHTVSVQQGTASTSLVCAYVRAGEGVAGVYSPESPVRSAVYSLESQSKATNFSSDNSIKERQDKLNDLEYKSKYEADKSSDKNVVNTVELYDKFKTGLSGS